MKKNEEVQEHMEGGGKEEEKGGVNVETAGITGREAGRRRLEPPMGSSDGRRRGNILAFGGK